jgi:cytidine deaminase
MVLNHFFEEEKCRSSRRKRSDLFVLPMALFQTASYQKVTLVLAGAVIGTCFTLIVQNKFRHSKLSNDCNVFEKAGAIGNGDEDDFYINLAQMERIGRACPPKQSNFRVVAVVVFTNPGSTKKRFVIGHNDESCCITNSCCAEKSAFLQLARQPLGTIVSTVYVISDSPSIITPGVICREFMLSSPFIATPPRVVLEGSDGKITRTSCSLEKLFPYASPYMRLDSQQQILEGKRLKRIHNRNSESFKQSGGGGTLLTELQQRVRALAMKGSKFDVRDDLHPIRYGAGVIFEDGSEAYSGQKIALEYGCSQDAICQLAPYFEQRKSSLSDVKPIIICMSDQFGVCHAPFSIGRSYLTENGLEDLAVLCQDKEGNFFEVKAKELVPGVPEWSRPPSSDRNSSLLPLQEEANRENGDDDLSVVA